MRIARNILCFILFQFIVGQQIYAQKIDSKVSTLFLFYFSKYIEWPNEKKSIQLGIVAGEVEFERIKSVLMKKKSSDKKISLVHLKDAKSAPNCDLIFISSDNANQLNAYFQNCYQAATVMVVEKIGATKKGAGIEIYLDEDDDNKTKFVINKKLLETKGFKLSSQLLSLSN